MESKINRLYIYQARNISIKDTLSLVEDELSKTLCEVDKEIHQYYGFSTAYKIPAFSGYIYMFPVVESFVNLLLPARYTTNDFPESNRETLLKLAKRSSVTSSILFELPEGLSEVESTYLIKLMGLCFPGYYSPVSDLPDNGLLNKTNHMHITTNKADGFDVFSELESIILGHVSQ